MNDKPVTMVLTPETLIAPSAPTLYFIGVSTGRSSIQRVFPEWAAYLGLTDAVLTGVDMPIHADPAAYRQVVDFIKSNPMSLGALVTTHKIDLYRASRDQFDIVDEHAQRMGELSCLSKRDGKLICHAKDPISSGLALDAFIPAGYWLQTPAEAVILGAGGSAIAISWYLSRPDRGRDRPSRIVVTNRSAARLEHLKEIHAGLDTDTTFDYVIAPESSVNSRLVEQCPSGSLIVNATGLGKDAPGSPLDNAALFPSNGIAWDLNYRGDLVFLDQAHSQQTSRNLQVEDGWIYFLHGWTQVIAEVFDIEIQTTGPKFDTLSDLAVEARGPRTLDRAATAIRAVELT